MPGRHRRAFDLAVADSVDMKAPVDSEPHPFDVALQIQAGLFQLNLNRPVADTVEVADADPLAFEFLQRLDVRRRHPDVGVLIAPAAKNVKIGAPRALIKNRPRLHIERDIDRLSFIACEMPSFSNPNGTIDSVNSS